ncbi:tryptophan synthase subunit beta, partial [Pseudoalteromonas sp. S185]
RMKLRGAEVSPVTAGTPTVKDAGNEAVRDGAANYQEAHDQAGTAAGPHPFQTIVREYQKVCREEAKQQELDAEGSLPDAVITSVASGCNAISIFS